ncbi:MAG: winged helix-turn-helix domain-containing protein [Pseudodonghicola sp.]|nr:winged helix-turn-helix domain-containing protein [Pseudodonghicola sp.]
MSAQDKHSALAEIELDDCVVRPATNEILRGGKTFHLEPKSMEVLSYLIAHSGEVVTRDDLHAWVWPDVHVGDDSLTGAIIKIRRALADDARNPTYIETIPKRGYRLIAPVRTSQPTRATPREPSMSSRPRRRWPIAVAGVLIAVVTVAVMVLWRVGPAENDGAGARAQPGDRIVVAVAPFVNAGRDGAQDYLARGISETIVNDLAHIPELAIRQYDSEKTSRAAPDFDYVLEGSVLRSGDTVRITARLVDGTSGQVLDSLRFERSFADLLAIEDEIRDTLLDKLRLGISTAEHSRRAHGYTENIAAYDLFLRAQRDLLIRTQASNRAARSLYQEAIARDPNFARAYGGLALTYAADYRNGWAAERAAALGAALKYAGTALEIAPNLPEQHWVVGYVKTQQRQYDDARAALQKAIDIDAGFADAYALSGGIETYRGTPEQTVPLLRKALRLNPDAGYLYFLLLARAYYFLGDFKQALINLDEANTRNPQNIEVHLYRAATLFRLNRADDAAWEAEEVRSIEPAFRLDTWSASYPMARGKQFDRLLSDLSKAGFS